MYLIISTVTLSEAEERTALENEKLASTVNS